MIAAVWPGAPWICVLISQLWVLQIYRSTNMFSAVFAVVASVAWIGLGVALVE